jgi:arylsulfatase A-like enzyme
MERKKTRREFLKTLGFGAASVALPSWMTSCTKRKPPPNILFIAIDDLNDWANCLGGRPGVHTPHLDRLAKKGVLFTNAHCAAPACNPSRTSVFTGIRPSTSGIYYNRQHWRKSPILERAVTIPEHFRSLGYRAVGGGKLFHCLSWIKTSYGRDGNDPAVWDEYFPTKTKPMPDFIWPEDAVRDEFETVTWTPRAGAGTDGRPPYYFDWGFLAESDERTSDFKVVDWVGRELQKNHEKPLFLAVGIFRPHIPWFVPKRYFDLYPLKEISLPAVKENDLEDCSSVGKGFCRREWQKWILENDQWKPAVQAYLASISFADAKLGRLLAALDASPYRDNTIIVLWSDHGMHIGEKEHWEKFTLWEESTRVPLIFVVPGMTREGGLCEQPVSLLDIYPTLVELSGHEPRPSLEGQSLVPLLKRPNLETGRAVVTTYGHNNHGIRSLDWRYIRYHDASEELYDHQSDPDEYTNLSAQEEYAEVKKELATWLPRINQPPIELKE